MPSSAHSTASRSRSASRILRLVGESSGNGEDRGAEALFPKLVFELACAALGLGQPLGDSLLFGERRVLGLLGRLELAELRLGRLERLLGLAPGFALPFDGGLAGLAEVATTSAWM